MDRLFRDTGKALHFSSCDLANVLTAKCSIPQFEQFGGAFIKAIFILLNETSMDEALQRAVRIAFRNAKGAGEIRGSARLGRSRQNFEELEPFE